MPRRARAAIASATATSPPAPRRSHRWSGGYETTATPCRGRRAHQGGGGQGWNSFPHLAVASASPYTLCMAGPSTKPTQLRKPPTYAPHPGDVDAVREPA
jgi:hypothetical protein